LRILILGLGNHTFAGEQVGLDVARALHELLGDPDVDIIEAPATAMDLLEIAAGYHKVVVVDSIRHGQGDVGELRKLGLADLQLVPREGGAADLEYRATIEVDRATGRAVPLEISIYAIEMGEGSGRDDDIEEAIREAVPRLVEQIAREEFGQSAPGAGWL
jgi:hydrogenase maturation protease